MDYLLTRPHAAKKTIGKLWPPGSDHQESKTTDDLPSARDNAPLRKRLVRRSSNPLANSHWLRRSYSLTSKVSQSSLTLHSIFDNDAKMVTRATIAFEHPSTERTVYVVTDMSSPAWQPLEMIDSGKRNEAGDVIFIREFDNVAEGNHQYKIRIGDGDWVLDSSKDTASDGAGHVNNIVRAATVRYTNHPSKEHLSSQEQPVGVVKKRQDSVQCSPDVPFLALVEAQGQEQLENGVTVAEKRPINIPKIEIGTAIEDFAHGAQAVDARPEQRLDTDRRAGNSYSEQGAAAQTPDELSSTFVFRHEVNTSTEAPSPLNIPPPENRMSGISVQTADTIDFTSSEDSGHVSSNNRDVSEFDLNTMAHERTHTIRSGDEADVEFLSELDRAPSFSHEATSNFSGSRPDELDLAPHLSHESLPVISSPGKNQSGASSSSDMRKASFGGGGPEFAHEEGQSDEHAGPSSPIFSKLRPFRRDLPKTMAHTDSDDDNATDGSLEKFPIDRRQITERLNSIETSYPVDEPDHIFVNSPDIQSQACSSVDLAPVQSYMSLASIPESTLQEETEIEEVASLPSPVLDLKPSSDGDAATSSTATASAKEKGKGKEPVSQFQDPDKMAPLPPLSASPSPPSPSDSFNPEYSLFPRTAPLSIRTERRDTLDSGSSATGGVSPRADTFASSQQSPSKSPLEKKSKVLAPAQVLHNAREDFIAKGVKGAAENETVRHEMIAAPQQEPQQQRQQAGGWFSRLLGPLRQAVGRCFGAGPEDQSLRTYLMALFFTLSLGVTVGYGFYRSTTISDFLGEHGMFAQDSSMTSAAERVRQALRGLTLKEVFGGAVGGAVGGFLVWG